MSTQVLFERASGPPRNADRRSGSSGPAGGRFGRAGAYGLSGLASLVALAMTLALKPLIGEAIFPLLLAAVFASTWLGGFGPGVAATGLCAAGAAWLLMDETAGAGPLMVKLGIFAATAMGVSALTSGLRRAARESQRGEERFHFLVESIQDYAIFMLDLEGRVASWNAGAQRLFGLPEKEILGKPHAVFFTPEDAGAELPAEALRVARAEGRFQDEGWRLRGDGTRFWAECSLTALRGPHGEHVGFVKLTRDLTERRRAEESLRRSNERFRLLVEGVQDYAIFFLDTEGRVETWNAGARKVKGYAAREAIGKPYEVFFTAEDRAAGKPAKLLLEANARGSVSDQGWRIRKDGSLFWADALLTALRDEDGRLRGYAKVTRDLTERHRAEEALAESARELERRVRERTRELEEANRELDAFASLVAHDLRMPLRAVQIYPGMIEASTGGRLKVDEKEDLERIKVAGQRMDGMIQDLLAYSRLRKQDLATEVVDLGAVASEVLKDLGPALTERRARVEIAEHLPPLRANRVALLRVLANLVSNAATYVAAGVEPRIALNAERRGDRVRFWVEDNGIGVAAEHKERIFRPLERLHRYEDYPGTGLGLAIAKRAVERMGGSIGVESEPGKGSKFWVELSSP